MASWACSSERCRGVLAAVVLLAVLLGGCGSFPHLPESEAARREREQRIASLVARMDSVVKSYLGTRYRLGGTDRRGIDCSGLTRRVYEAVDVKLPRTAAQQFDEGRNASASSLQYGDLVFFNTKEHDLPRLTCLLGTLCPTADVPVVYGLTHTGMYVGEGRFVHAAASRGVSYAELGDAYWADRYIGARRFLEDFE